MHRSVRRFLATVPGPDSSLALLGPLGTEIEVVPYHGRFADGWEWQVRLTFGGRPSPVVYSYVTSWRSPAPYEVRGRSRNQGQAWIAGRAVVDEVRRRNAATESDRMQRHAQRVPL